MVGSSSFRKQTKYCEYCLSELEQISFVWNGVIKYTPGYKACDCTQSKAAREKENEIKRMRLAQEEQRKQEEARKETDEYFKRKFQSQGLNV